MPIRSSIGKLLSPALAELLGAEAPDPVQPETENHPVLFSKSHVEARKLARHRTAVPGVSKGHGRADQRAVASSRPLLEVEKERRAAKKPLVAIAEKHRRAPLRATHRPSLESSRVSKFCEAPDQLDRARVVVTLKHLND